MKIEKRDLVPTAVALEIVLEFIADYSATVTHDKRRREIDAAAIMLRALHTNILKAHRPISDQQFAEQQAAQKSLLKENSHG